MLFEELKTTRFWNRENSNGCGTPCGRRIVAPKFKQFRDRKQVVTALFELLQSVDVVVIVSFAEAGRELRREYSVQNKAEPQAAHHE